MRQSEKEQTTFFNPRSIRFKTWVYFFLLAAIVLIILWLVQLVFFKAYYQSMKKAQIERVGDAMTQAFPGGPDDEEFREQVLATAFSDDVNIVVFTARYEVQAERVELNAFHAEYVSFLPEKEEGEALINFDNPKLIDDYPTFLRMASANDRFTYLYNAPRRGSYLVYGAHLKNNYYLYINTTLAPVDSTTSILANQLIMVTGICLLLSIVLSYFISSHITRPISEFSRVAQKLAKGDYTVRFEGNGYTEIEDLAETLNYATEEMGKTEALRRDFLANVSHDLRTPLTMVKAYAEMIRDISGSDEVKRAEHSQVIIDEADRLTALVNDILNLSKLQAGTEELACEPFDMGQLMRSVTERFDGYVTRDGYCFVSDIDEGCVVTADSRRIEQVLYNLMGNAINYAGEDKKIYLFVRKEQDRVSVGIADGGKGIAPDEIDAVWERYYRASQRKRGVVGTGLGLSIVKNILMAHKAEYGVKSRVGEGTLFWFSLPAVSQESSVPQLAAPAERPHREGRKRKKE